MSKQLEDFCDEMDEGAIFCITGFGCQKPLRGITNTNRCVGKLACPTLYCAWLVRSTLLTPESLQEILLTSESHFLKKFFRKKKSELSCVPSVEKKKPP